MLIAVATPAYSSKYSMLQPAPLFAQISQVWNWLQFLPLYECAASAGRGGSSVACTMYVFVRNFYRLPTILLAMKSVCTEFHGHQARFASL